MSDVAAFNHIKRLLNACIRHFAKIADQPDGKAGKEKTRDNLIKTEERKLLPNEDGETADNDAGKDAVTRGAAPE